MLVIIIENCIWHCLPIDYYNFDGQYQYAVESLSHCDYVHMPLKILGTVWMNLALSYDDTFNAFMEEPIGGYKTYQGNSNTVFYEWEEMGSLSYYYRNNFSYIWYCIPYYATEDSYHDWGSKFNSSSKMDFKSKCWYIHGSINYNLNFSRTASAGSFGYDINQSLNLGDDSAVNNSKDSGPSSEIHYSGYYRKILFIPYGIVCRTIIKILII